MKKLSFFIASALALASCSSNNEPANTPQEPVVPSTSQEVNLDDLFSEGPESETPIPLSDNDKKSCEAANAFALRLFDAISTDSPAENAVISPMSVFSTLSMLANGDKSGEVRDEILAICAPTVGLEGLNQLNSFNALILDYLPRLDNKTVCHFANAIMHNPSIDISNDYMAIVSHIYNAEHIPQAPIGAEGMQTVNDWVSKKTNGMIPNFLKSPINDQIALINAAYFKGQWTLPFNEKYTEIEDFENLDGSVSKIPFMHVVSSIEYAETEYGRYVELTYGYRNYKFCALLPSGNDNSLKDISLEKLQAMAKKAKLRIVSLSMPKFGVESDWDLGSMFDDLGLSKLVAADIDGIVEEAKLPFNTLLHSAAIKINENGAEASAASFTGMLMADLDDIKQEPTELSLNQPFLFFIKENSSDVILYIGAVNKL